MGLWIKTLGSCSIKLSPDCTIYPMSAANWFPSLTLRIPSKGKAVLSDLFLFFVFSQNSRATSVVDYVFHEHSVLSVLTCTSEHRASWHGVGTQSILVEFTHPEWVNAPLGSALSKRDVRCCEVKRVNSVHFHLPACACS